MRPLTILAVLGFATTASAMPMDSDGDQIPDAVELQYGSDPFDDDTDDDGLRDGTEVRHGLDPLNPDSDADGLSDGDEVLVYRSHPLRPDTDRDGLLDGDEVHQEVDRIVTLADVNLSYGGLTRVDEACATSAQLTGLAGSYLAWVSLEAYPPQDPQLDARDRLPPLGRFVLDDGTLVAEDLFDLVDGSIHHPIDRWDGQTYIADFVATGTLPDGTLAPGDTTCSGWGDEYYRALVGDQTATDGTWTASYETSRACDPFAWSTVYCFQVDPVTPPSDPTNPDTDGDGLSDRQERLLGLHPGNPDTDRDGVDDGDEIAARTNPRGWLPRP